MLAPSAPSARARGAALLLTLAAVLTACTDDSARPAAPTGSSLDPSTSLTSLTSPTSTASTQTAWQAVTDRATGIRFELPDRAAPRRSQRAGRSGTAVASREYAATSGDVRLSVSILTTPSRPRAVRRTVRPQYLPFLVVRTVRAQGARQAGVVGNTRLRDLPYDGFDSQLTFVQRGRRAVWFTRAVELPRAVVVAQAVAYVPVDEDAVDRVRAEFDRLVEGLVIPGA